MRTVCITALMAFVGMGLACGGGPAPTPNGQGGANQNAAPDALASHPWWKVPMTPSVVNGVVAKIAAVRPPDNLFVRSNGQTSKVRIEGNYSRSGPPFGLLQDDGDFCQIHFVPTHGRITTQEARSLLARMLDEALASDKKRAEMGRGDTINDQLLNMKAPQEAIDEHNRREAELRKAREAEQKKPLFPNLDKK